jgi:hypothetical protein
MSSIKVNWQGADFAVSAYQAHKRDVSNTIASLRSVKSYRCMRGGHFSQIYRAIDSSIVGLEKNLNSLGNLENGILNILKEYERCENSLGTSGITTGVGAAAKWATGNKGFLEGNLTNEAMAWAKKGFSANDIDILVKKLGPVAVGKGRSEIIRDVVEKVRDYSKKVSKVLKNPIFDNKKFLKMLGKTTGAVLKKGKKIAGWAEKIASSFLDNYDEHGGINARMLAETGSEIAVRAGINVVAKWGATALVGGIIGAMGLPITAPAALVGAAAVGLTMAGDAICKWATKKFLGQEKDLTEFISDTALDLGKAAFDGMSKVGKKAVDGLAKVGKGAVNFFKGGMKAVSNYFKSNKEKILDTTKNIAKSAAKTVAKSVLPVWLPTEMVLKTVLK